MTEKLVTGTKQSFFLTFRPTGWDNDKKIGILYENLQSMKAEDGFNDVLAKPVTRKVRNTRTVLTL